MLLTIELTQEDSTYFPSFARVVPTAVILLDVLLILRCIRIYLVPYIPPLSHNLYIWGCTLSAVAVSRRYATLVTVSDASV
jgi:hypothetical protein